MYRYKFVANCNELRLVGTMDSRAKRISTILRNIRDRFDYRFTYIKVTSLSTNLLGGVRFENKTVEVTDEGLNKLYNS